MLKRLTSDQILAEVKKELAAGNYRSIAERVVAFAERDPNLAQRIVPLLAGELSKIGDKNPGRSGPGAKRTPTRADTRLAIIAMAKEHGAQHDYQELARARDIVDGKSKATAEETELAVKLLRAWKLSPSIVPRQKFNFFLRAAVATKRKLSVEKVSELTRRKRKTF